MCSINIGSIFLSSIPDVAILLLHIFSRWDITESVFLHVFFQLPQCCLLTRLCRRSISMSFIWGISLSLQATFWAVSCIKIVIIQWYVAFASIDAEFLPWSWGAFAYTPWSLVLKTITCVWFYFLIIWCFFSLKSNNLKSKQTKTSTMLIPLGKEKKKEEYNER